MDIKNELIKYTEDKFEIFSAVYKIPLDLNESDNLFNKEKIIEELLEKYCYKIKTNHKTYTRITDNKKEDLLKELDLQIAASFMEYIDLNDLIRIIPEEL